MSESEKLWPTPQAFDANDVPNGNSEERKKKGGCKNLCQETAVWFTPTTGQQHQEITQGMIDHHLRTGEGNLMEMAGAFMAEMSRSRSSARVSRASRFQLLASVRELLTSVTSGPKSPASFARLSQDGSWVKTSEDCSLFPMDEFSVPFSETWPTWGTVADGVAMALTKPLEQPIEGTECSSSDFYPTPRGQDGIERRNRKTMEKIANHGGDMTLPTWAATQWQTENWATPSGQTGGQKSRGGARKDELLLGGQAQVWRTPSAGDVEGGIMDINLAQEMGYNPKIKLRDHAPGAMDNWATEDFPQAQPTSTHGEPSSPHDQTSPPPSPARRRLNWRFVEWLMGFPEGWL